MSLKDILVAKREALVAQRDAWITERKAIADGGAEAFDKDAEARFDALTDKIGAHDGDIEKIDARIADLDADEKREMAASTLRKQTVEVTVEPNPVYRKGDSASPSYFADLADSQRGDRAATQRLIDSQERALTTTAGAGGEMAPPLWLAQDFIELARAARVTADLVENAPLPQGVSSISLPKVATGTAVGVTQTQATAITQTDLTTTSVSSSIATITGGQKVALQLIKQSAVSMDSVVLSDLALAYASGLDVQVLNGSNANGQLKGLATAGTTVTYTTTAPAVVSATAAANFYGKVMSGISAMTGSRLLPPDAIVMHPRRWAWIMNALDSQTRPLVVPNGSAFNPAATGGVAAQGPAGTLAGLPVYLDANIATNLGAATNQDQVFILRRGDHMLFEAPVEAASFEATYAADNSVFFRVVGFAAFITRHAASAQVIDGTGLVAPTF